MFPAMQLLFIEKVTLFCYPSHQWNMWISGLNKSCLFYVSTSIGSYLIEAFLNKAKAFLMSVSLESLRSSSKVLNNIAGHSLQDLNSPRWPETHIYSKKLFFLHCIIISVLLYLSMAVLFACSTLPALLLFPTVTAEFWWEDRCRLPTEMSVSLVVSWQIGQIWAKMGLSVRSGSSINQEGSRRTSWFFHTRLMFCALGESLKPFLLY